MKIITSRTNPEVKAVHALHQAKCRNKEQLFIAEGTRACSTIINSDIKLKQLFVIEPLLDKAYTLAPRKLITTVSDSVMEKMSSLASPPGILGVFSIPKEPSFTTIPNGIVLAGISDPGNMGTLIRSAAAMNVSSVFITEGTDPWSPKVVQASAGTIGLVSIFQWDWQKIVTLKKQLTIVALTVDGKKKPEEIKKKNVLLVIGSEAHGIPKSIFTDCNETITIPMPGKVESLNAAIAGSIALYLVFVQ